MILEMKVFCNHTTYMYTADILSGKNVRAWVSMDFI